MLWPIWAGILLGWYYAVRLSRRPPQRVTRAQLDDFVLYAVLGVIVGGRLGYVIFYQPDYFLLHPLAILQLWHGGMSFHGGMAGVIVALALFARRRGISGLALADIVAEVAPIGLAPRAGREFHQWRAVGAAEYYALGDGVSGGWGGASAPESALSGYDGRSPFVHDSVVS